MSKILTLEAHNVGRVKDINFDLSGHHLFLVGGKNDNGKSSAINSLAVLLCGKREFPNYPEILLSNGEDEGWIKSRIEGPFDDFHEPNYLDVELKLRRMRGGTVLEELRVLDSAGEQASEPRTLLKRLFHLKGFDPLSFVREKPEAQKAMIEQLTGLDFTEEREQYKSLVEERRVANREEKAAKARLDGMPCYADVEEKSATELMERIDALATKNRENADERQKLATMQKQLDATVKSAAEVREQIEALQRKLKGLDDAVIHWTEQAARQKGVVDELKDMDVAPLREQMKTIEADNQKARANAKRKEALATYNEWAEKATDLDERVKALVAAQDKKLAEAKFPVAGMSLDKEGLLLNGLPFGQASRAQRIMASVDVGIALNPHLRLLICENGSDLDAETIEALDVKLKEHDFQMLVEMVTRVPEDESRCQIIMVDGKAAKPKKG